MQPDGKTYLEDKEHQPQQIPSAAASPAQGQHTLLCSWACRDSWPGKSFAFHGVWLDFLIVCYLLVFMFLLHGSAGEVELIAV